MKCDYCNKKKGILLDCIYCKNEYCSACISLEIHKCENIEDCKKRKRNELENKLNLERSEKNKVIKI